MSYSETIHRAKLRQPRHGDGLVHRPRLTASLDRAPRPTDAARGVGWLWQDDAWRAAAAVSLL